MEISPARKWALNQFIYHEMLEDLHSHFSKLKIPYMPIKGAYLLCTGLASSLKQRAIKDIDILVQPQHMQSVSDYFSGLEQVQLKMYYTDNYRPTETSFLFPIGKALVQVEIHSQINFEQRFILHTDDLFSRAIVAGGYRRLPTPEDSLLIFICHLQSHIPFEFRESNGEEISALVSVKSFDWNLFWRLSRKTGLESFIYFILKYYSRRYPVALMPSRACLYAAFLAKVFSEARYNRVPGWLRRLLFDIPFVRKPLWLLVHKVFHRRHRSK